MGVTIVTIYYDIISTGNNADSTDLECYNSQKAVETETCMILSLVLGVTPDPPFDLLLSALSMISTAALTGESTSMKLSCRIRF
jgi:hypothetical protein